MCPSLGSCTNRAGAFCLLLRSKAVSPELRPPDLLWWSSLPHATQAHLFQTEHVKPKFLPETVTHSTSKGQPSPCPKAEHQLLRVPARDTTVSLGQSRGEAELHLWKPGRPGFPTLASSRLPGP